MDIAATMVNNREYIEKIINLSENQQYLKNMFSDHFDCLDKPILVSIGVHFERKTLESVVKKLRESGIDALPYYDPEVKNRLDCFVVDGTGISSPVLDPKDAIKATADIVSVMQQNNIKTSLAIPVSQEALIPAVTRTYANNIMDMQINNPLEENVDGFIAERLNEVDKNIDKAISVSNGDLWRGGTLGDKPYAISHHDRKRDVAYGTNDLATAIGYADGYDGKGLTFKTINGKSYGFLYQFAEADKQRYYSMAFIENGGESEECKGRPENRPDYETPIIPSRNPLKSIYVITRDTPVERGKSKESKIDLNQYKAVKIADENGYLSSEWEKFAKLHTPYNTNERNDYMVERMNKQIADYVPVKYNRSNGVDLDDNLMEPSIKGLVFSKDIKELDGDMKCKFMLKDANFNSFSFPSDCDVVQFSGNFMADNCQVSEGISRLDLSKCSGIVGISNCDLSKIKEIVLPEKCFCFFLENVKLPKNQILDFNKIQCEHQKMVLRDCDFSDNLNLSIPKDIQLKGKTQLPKSKSDFLEIDKVKRIKELRGLSSLGKILYSPKPVSREQLQGLRYISNRNGGR